ncbi:MAG: hypothetical protein B7Y99_00245 [Caulobacterales bacterium 32-69-10]|nr:MAG: hypothetical protein B7Y99_00245 [Caulobacterales bacterium 32-69-10]
MTNRVTCIALAGALALTASYAVAHPRLISASPERGEKLASSPKEVRVKFSEPIKTASSKFELQDAAGKALRTGALKNATGDQSTVVLPIAAKLGPGIYSVKWSVVSEAHASVPGRYNFEIKR